MTSFLDHFELSLADVAAGQRVPIPLFPLGTWKSSKYPTLPLTRELADELIAGFEAGLLGTEPVLDSSGSHDTSAPAAGWFKKLYVAPTKDGGEMLFGDAELTDLGAQMLNDGLYKYDSIEIGPVVDNATGAKTDNVFRSATLTNTPVLRILPPILDAADTIALSEITMSEPGSYQALRDELEVAIGRGWVCDFGPDWVVYEDGVIDANRTYKAPYTKSEAGITLGVPVEVKRETTYVPADSSPAGAQPASSPTYATGMADEGHGAHLSEGDAAKKGVETLMKTVALKLSLAEDASEEAILAAVTTLAEHDAAETERANAAEAKLAEAAKTAALTAFEAKLDEKITGGFIATGERETYVKLASEQSVELAESMVEARTAKVIETGERGSDAEGPTYADASVELAEKAKARAAKDGIDIVKAQALVLAEDRTLAERVQSERYGKEA